MGIIIGNKLGYGATADVYEYGSGRVVKLYHKKYTKEYAEKEYKITKSIWELGLPAPNVFEIVEYEDSYGLVMEYIDGETIEKNLINIFQYSDVTNRMVLENHNYICIENMIKKCADVFYRLHKKTINLNVNAKDFLYEKIKNNQYLSLDEKNSINLIINSLPDATSVCHGDLNLKNIIMRKGNYILLDWMDAANADPLFDIARYIVSNKYIDTTKIDEKYIKFINYLSGLLQDVFLSEYKKISNIDMTLLDLWIIPVLAVKINLCNDEKFNLILLKELRKLLQNMR